MKGAAREKLMTEIGYMTKFVLKGKKFLGSQFTAADVYAYVCLG